MGQMRRIFLRARLVRPRAGQKQGVAAGAMRAIGSFVSRGGFLGSRTSQGAPCTPACW